MVKLQKKTLLMTAIVAPLCSLALEASAAEHTVKILSGTTKEMRFDPQDIEVKVGDTVTWVNEKPVYHNVRALKKDIPEGAEPLKSPPIKKAGEKWSYTFEVAGKYDYFCVPHRAMGMVGSVTVSE